MARPRPKPGQGQAKTGQHSSTTIDNDNDNDNDVKGLECLELCLGLVRFGGERASVRLSTCT